MKKDIEREILEYLDNSKDFWTDLYPIMEKSEYSFNDFYKVLKDLVDEGIIKAENGKRFYGLNSTRKGKLVGSIQLIFKLIDKGQLRLRNALYNLTENSIKSQKANKPAKGHTSIIQIFYWLVGIVLTLLTINYSINEQFDFDTIKYIFNKF